MRYQMTTEDANALSAWAEDHGRNWKTYLRQAWHSGGCGAQLQCLRNNAGPVWLSRVTLRQIIAKQSEV